MRTLKVLSLVLALVLCFGLVGTAFATNYDKYSDAAKVGADYAEAVDVLIGAGIVDGKTETTVDPTGAYTREQAAKIIAYMLLGKAIADSLPKDAAPFDDVAASRWSAGYIAYCANEGIISGVAAGKFNPQGELTGYAFAKMLLVALGYKGEYEGKTWSINVAKDALQAGIFTGDLTAATNAPIERQQAMLMAFNGLFKGETKSTTTTKYVTQITTGTPPTTTQTIWDTYAQAKNAIDNLGHTYVGDMPVTQTVQVGSLADTVYGIVVNDGATDEFGRPITTYTRAGRTIAAVPADANKIYTRPVSPAQIFADLGLNKAVTAANLFIDGAAQTAITGTFTYDNSAPLTASGNGVELSVYYSARANVITLYAVNYYHATVTAVNPATTVSKESVTVTCPAKAAITAAPAFEISGLKQRDHVIVTFDAVNGKIVSMEKVAPVTLEPTSITNNQSFIAGGQTYTYNKNIVLAEKLASAAGNLTAKMVFLDKYGYAISIDDPFVPANYGVVLAIENVTFPTASKNAYILKADGKTEIIKGVVFTGGTGAAGDIVDIDDSIPGVTMLDIKASKTATPIASIKPGVVTSTDTGTGSFKANDKTLFLMSYNTTTGTKYAAYVGVANVPEVNGSVSYTVYNFGSYAAAVFVDTATFPAVAATTQTMVYANRSSAVKVQDSVKGLYWTMNAVVDGTPTKIEVSNAIVTAMTSGDEIWGAVTKDANGIITAKSTYAGTGIAIVTGKTGTTAAADGIVKFGIGSAAVELTYTDNTQVFKITPIGATKITVDGITDDANDTVIYVTRNGVLTAAYITVV